MVNWNWVQVACGLFFFFWYGCVYMHTLTTLATTTTTTTTNTTTTTCIFRYNLNAFFNVFVGLTCTFRKEHFYLTTPTTHFIYGYVRRRYGKQPFR